jgi:DNA primase
VKGHTLWSLVRKVGTRDQLLEYRDRFMPANKRDHRCLDLTLVEPQKLQLPKDFKLIVTSSLRDPDALALRKYLASRRVSERDMWYFKLGYSNELRWKRRVLVPSFDAQGELSYFVGRAIDKFRRPKYDGPDTDPGYKLTIVFNELNVDWSRELVLCEGTFDLMKCPDNAVPLLGSDLNEQSALFNAIVVNNTPVALALDADMWVKKTPRIARRLAEYNVAVRTVRVPLDPGDMTKREFRQLLVDARPFSWDGAFMDKLDVAARVSLGR